MMWVMNGPEEFSELLSSHSFKNLLYRECSLYKLLKAVKICIYKGRRIKKVKAV